MTKEPGPSLEQYIETRLNLMIESAKAMAAKQDAALLAASEASMAAAVALKAATDAALLAADLRYQQRFEAQSDALSAAFLSQQTAMQTAFTVAEKAVQAALAAADRAVAKAEGAADKRFDALNELRQMLNDMVGNLMPRIESVQRFDGLTEKIDATNARVGQLDARVNVTAGEKSGAKANRDDTKALWAVGISIAGLLITIVMSLLRFVGKA